MTTNTISYEETGYFSKLICDYLAEDTALTDFYGRFPKLENFKRQIEAKKETFTSESRNALVEQLKTQYKSFKISEATQQNIELLSEENPFTITTGQVKQLPCKHVHVSSANALNFRQSS